MKVMRFTPKEFARRHGPFVVGWHETSGEGEHVIELPYGASTKTKMHEIAHAELGHVGPTETFGELAKRELEADKWVYEKLGKEPSSMELFHNFTPFVEELADKRYSLHEVFNWIKEEIENAGYQLERGDRSALWWWLRDYYEARHRG